MGGTARLTIPQNLSDDKGKKNDFAVQESELKSVNMNFYRSDL